MKVEASRVERRLALSLARGTPGEFHRPCPAQRAARLVGALHLPVTASTATWLSEISPEGFDDEQRLMRLRLADRVAAWAQASAAGALADYVGPDTGDAEADRHRRLEIRIARGCSDDAAGNDIATARALAGPCRPVRRLWRRGEIGYRHVAAVVGSTAHLDDELATEVVAVVAPSLARTDATRVRAKVARTTYRIDPQAQARRARVRRRHDVGVAFRSLPDGLAQLTATVRVEDARAALERIDSLGDRFLAHQRECEPCAVAVPDEVGPARAHVFVSLVLGPDDGGARSTGAGAEGSSTSPRPSRRGELQVVVDLATLLGLAEQPGLVAGQPVPSEIVRELATECGSLRRIVTDPLTGALLDYGTRTYLPQPLKDFVAARDGTCRSPGCGQPAARSQLDHVVPFPHGPSDPANTHALCKRDHDSKTRGDLRLREHRADGSARWSTRDGQHGVTPPRPYLGDPDDIPPF